MANTPGAGVMPGAKKNKEEVKYRIAESCASCDYFWRASDNCDLVAGNIGPDMLCDMYSLKSQQEEGKDKAFYEAEYMKAKAKSGKMSMGPNGKMMMDM